MRNRSPAPMALWKIVLLWLVVGVGCVVWTTDDDCPPASTPIVAARYA